MTEKIKRRKKWLPRVPLSQHSAKQKIQEALDPERAPSRCICLLDMGPDQQIEMRRLYERK